MSFPIVRIYWGKVGAKTLTGVLIRLRTMALPVFGIQPNVNARVRILIIMTAILPRVACWPRGMTMLLTEIAAEMMRSVMVGIKMLGRTSKIEPIGILSKEWTTETMAGIMTMIINDVRCKE